MSVSLFNPYHVRENQPQTVEKPAKTERAGAETERR